MLTRISSAEEEARAVVVDWRDVMVGVNLAIAFPQEKRLFLGNSAK